MLQPANSSAALRRSALGCSNFGIPFKGGAGPPKECNPSKFRLIRFTHCEEQPSNPQADPLKLLTLHSSSSPLRTPLFMLGTLHRVLTPVKKQVQDPTRAPLNQGALAKPRLHKEPCVNSKRARTHHKTLNHT